MSRLAQRQRAAATSSTPGCRRSTNAPTSAARWPEPPRGQHPWAVGRRGRDRVGSGRRGRRRRLALTLSDSTATAIVVEHGDRLARFGFEHIEAALSAQRRRILVVDDGETELDLV